jgi:primosomal protein N' (replication factor Y)
VSETVEQPALFAEPEVEVEHVEVAVPVPLRRTFTYRVPKGLAGRLTPGMRVAVPFSGRKLPAFVLDRVPPPEGVAADKIREVAGLLDREPIFPDELFQFLRAAASYYLHPLGEVLRAAAPAIPKDAIAALARDGFLGEGDALPGLALATKKTLVVRPSGARVEGARLGKKQEAVLDAIVLAGELEIAALRDVAKDARAVVRALADKGLVVTETREVVADPFFRGAVERDEAKILNPAQAGAVGAICETLLRDRSFEGSRTFLLHGVTGSGKTEVYLQAIAEARRAGKGALLLVPEIALTPQLVARFRARFGDAIAVLHSGLTDRERENAWRALRASAVTLAIGARSALFAPVPRLGIVVVDEEHDASFKQEDGFRYHARDMAMLRAQRAGAVAVLGSATPSIETRYLAQRGRIRLLELPDRATAQSLPSVEIVDLARNRTGPSGHPLLTAPLHRAIERCLASEGQAILFLNRRGFAPSVRCEACGEILECPACSVALTEHRRAGMLQCHYCDFATPSDSGCPKCGAHELERIGLGTEKLEESLREVFAPARVGRLDRDTASGRGVEHVLDALRRREIDILVGTQMVTKGHDVPSVTLVGVILADHSLAFPDFRASERTFQLLSQVAGRAGRGDRPGEVIFQTYQPGHHAVRLAAAHDYATFYRTELEMRRELGYTPFARLVAVRVDAGDKAKALAVAEDLAGTAARHPLAGAVRILGPSPAPIERLRGRFRFRVFLRSGDRKALRALALAMATRIDEGVAPARASVDIDPVSML